MSTIPPKKCTEPASSPAPVSNGIDPYRLSAVVRELLVLRALASSTKDLPKDLRDALPIAFEKVMHSLKNGRIQIDYRPASEGIVDIPLVSHEHYMQALLFWCSRFDCTLERLVEAHARLGKSPSVAHTLITLQQVEKEEAQAAKSFRTTLQRYQVQHTMPMMTPVRGKS